ncbi:MAG: Rrf2 family transcriptional regulator [Eubacterium sp.]|nr:Rrf2 family transcriptional regulator [Eubacterium sp.]
MISTKGRYALRVMLDMAERDTDQYIPLRDIAENQEISEKYLEAIIKLLVKGKLVKGLRGKGGGYRLTRRPEEYTVGEILELTEGNLAPVACLSPDADPCDRADNCRTLPMWKKLDKLEHDFFFGIKLDELMERDA